MVDRDVFLNISPLDHRYLLSNRDVFEHLARFLSEEAVIRYSLRVEIALLKTLVADPQRVSELDRIEQTVSPEEIYAEEEKTKHNIRALVNVLKRHAPADVLHLIHLGATSADIMDTSASLRYRDATRVVVLPLLVTVERELIGLCEREADTPQIGRTHGQHAVPMTFGFAMAEYVSRLGKSIVRLEDKSKNLRGKLAGAIGAYNALCLVNRDPEKLEREFLVNLGLQPSEHATQIVEPEYLLDLLLEMNTAFGILANLADDLRNLQRTEISEVREGFGRDQVGSSTMPQKRNPWNSEHVKSLWKAFSPRVMTFFLDQVSEHQRDLTNSASSRFVASYIAGFVAAVNRMKSVLSSLSVDRPRMSDNLARAGDLVLAEAAYVLLAKGGDLDAHEKVRKLTLTCERTGESLVEVMKRDSGLWEAIGSAAGDVLGDSDGGDVERFFSNPQGYTGIASRKARLIAERHGGMMSEIEEALK